MTTPRRIIFFQNKNEKSKTKEARDPSRSRVQRPKGL